MDDTGHIGDSGSVAQDVVKPIPAPKVVDEQRYQRLSRLRMRVDDQDLARRVLKVAVDLQLVTPPMHVEAEGKATGTVARYLYWHAGREAVFDPVTAFTRERIDEYLRLVTQRGHGLTQVQYELNRIGRVLHPQQYPRSGHIPGRRSKATDAATHAEIRRLSLIIPELPEALRWRAQAVFDLSYGAGVRSKDFRRLRGTAITAHSDGHSPATAVVILPNRSGGVREVPVADPVIGGRLIELSARAGKRLVLSPNRDPPERNLVNRVNEALRRRDHPGLSARALRNRWILDLSERVPATVLLQLVDLADVRILTDQKDQLPTYTTRNVIEILKGTHK